MIPKGTPNITLSAKEIRAIQDKARERKTLREFLIKEKSNPFRTAAAMGTGFITDPAFVRYEATQTFMTAYTYTRTTLKSFSFFWGVVVAPIFLIGYFSHSTRSAFDQKVRRGEIAYRDRFNKFL